MGLPPLRTRRVCSDAPATCDVPCGPHDLRRGLASSANHLSLSEQTLGSRQRAPEANPRWRERENPHRTQPWAEQQLRVGLWRSGKLNHRPVQEWQSGATIAGCIDTSGHCVNTSETRFILPAKPASFPNRFGAPDSDDQVSRPEGHGMHRRAKETQQPESATA